MEDTLKVRPGDFVIIFCVFVFIACGLIVLFISATRAGTKELVIKTPSAKYVYPLDRDKEIIVEGSIGPSTIAIRENAFAFISSPCPEHICEKTGWVKIPGFPVICIPNRVSAVIQIEDTEDVEIDGVSR